MQRPHGHDHRQGGAVGVRDDTPRSPSRRVRVDLRHYERHIRIHPERRGVVDRHGATSRSDRCPVRGHLVRYVEHRDVDAVEDLRAQRVDLELLAAYGQLSAGRPWRSGQSDLAPHVVPGRQEFEHDRANRAGRTDHCKRWLATLHRPVPPYTVAVSPAESRSNARCVAATAAGTSSDRQMTEILISEVEISSMFTPASASAEKKRAVTPGWVRIPAPISETLPTWSSYWRPSKPISSWMSERTAIAVGPSSLGKVKEISVRPVEAADTFWTIMSMLISASATVRKMAAASPGLSGTPTTVTFASLRSCATPAMIACSIWSPSLSSPSRSLTQVPSR